MRKQRLQKLQELTQGHKERQNSWLETQGLGLPPHVWTLVGLNSSPSTSQLGLLPGLYTSPESQLPHLGSGDRLLYTLGSRAYFAQSRVSTSPTLLPLSEFSIDFANPF